MTIKLRARIRKSSHPAYADAPWCIDAYVSKNGTPVSGSYAEATSHPAAVRAAHKLLADLDAELMAEVHASRASRRAERSGGCRDLGPHRNTPDCQYYTSEAP